MHKFKAIGATERVLNYWAPEKNQLKNTSPLEKIEGMLLLKM
jgi:hypothetical protein